MTNKEKYYRLCEAESSIPIFSQAWWLDAVADSEWDVALVEKGGVIHASLPYTFKIKSGFTLLSQPPLTQNLGPWLRRFDAKSSKMLSREKELLQLLFDKLPEYSRYSQNWHYSNKNWLPLFWKGFSQTTGYTYVLSCLESLDKLWDNVDATYRNKIRKAEKIVKVFDDMTVNQFYALNSKTFERQGMKVPYSFDVVSTCDEALANRQSRKIFYARDCKDNVHSALYLIWDNQSAYVHMVGEDPSLRSSGAGIYLIWEALKYTKNELKLKLFDFEGSMIEGVERVRRDFGAIQTPYLTLTHTPSKFLQLYDALKKMTT